MEWAEAALALVIERHQLTAPDLANLRLACKSFLAASYSVTELRPVRLTASIARTIASKFDRLASLDLSACTCGPMKEPEVTPGRLRALSRLKVHHDACVHVHVARIEHLPAWVRTQAQVQVRVYDITNKSQAVW